MYRIAGSIHVATPSSIEELLPSTSLRKQSLAVAPSGVLSGNSTASPSVRCTLQCKCRPNHSLLKKKQGTCAVESNAKESRIGSGRGSADTLRTSPGRCVAVRSRAERAPRKEPTPCPDRRYALRGARGGTAQPRCKPARTIQMKAASNLSIAFRPARWIAPARGGLGETAHVDGAAPACRP